tara:strand:+ start:127 stop:351 length:225 start_codon:yes stop_codon:yes gene_type:complete
MAAPDVCVGGQGRRGAVIRQSEVLAQGMHPPGAKTLDPCAQAGLLKRHEHNNLHDLLYYYLLSFLAGVFMSFSF